MRDLLVLAFFWASLASMIFGVLYLLIAPAKRLLEFLEIVALVLFMGPPALFVCVRGELAWRARARASRQETRRAIAARAGGPYPFDSQI